MADRPRRAFAGDLRFVLLGLAAGALIRIAFLALMLSRGWTHYDVDEVRVAHALLDGRGYSFDYFGLFGNALVPGAFFPPLYVYDAYWIMRLFGSETALAVQNLVFSVAILALVYLIAHRVFNRTAARAALWVGVVYLPFFSRMTHGSPVYLKMLLMCLALWSLLQTWVAQQADDMDEDEEC